MVEPSPPAAIDARLVGLRALAERGDCEAAAAGAAELRVEVLREIADGAADAAALATAVLATVDEDIGGS